ncbi:hypothetical protein [Rhodococcus chondri]|uniref:Serine/threonine protein kinase n=1 Tax=Rhodococcus chondri TaxID=3065941 RepID=A0ABU7JUL3_9NOCA|nr:hypothetical protein [Rhodococcus sp. CC-R104]MEE2033624.1 hypothetical protein [Rhodococcus sp. CC-R104]
MALDRGGILVVAIVATLAGLGILLFRNSDPGSDGAVAASPPVSTVTITASASSSAARPAPSSAPAPRGLPNNGILKVGTDIAPGEYAIRPTSSSGAYWERLSCLTGDFSCILANDNVQGNGYLTVLSSDIALRIDSLELIPTGNPAPATTPPTAPPTGSPPSAPTLDNTDRQGFVGVPQARCNHTNPAVAVGRTTESLVVVCETGAGRYYYKGVRLRDGAAIEIDDPVATDDGFTATNAGVQYRISSSSLLITKGSDLLAEEPMLQYWSQWPVRVS